ncbi:MAG TPA: exodeoxyribonuclease VII small subunit [Ignavibacteriales bacterium]|nr:exodeoxyribonuclease VII small subunit [Ignavibacteriales bacterium]
MANKKKITENIDDLSLEISNELNTQHQIDLEQAMIELEKISEQLEDPNIKLNDAIELFKKGAELAKICHKELTEAEIKIKEIKADLSEIEFRKEN